MDAEVAFIGPVCSPSILDYVLMAGFAFIGAQKAGTPTRIQVIQKGTRKKVEEGFWKRLKQSTVANNRCARS